mmetsp:Transcript_28676/g.96611  ORF Transcript_28676/g.96611 Transcript_28676/m.96611 type:complete len:104 (-) Transcript_28676:20-331(-)
MGHFLKTALLDPRTGDVSNDDGALYSLDEEEMQRFGEMIAAYGLRAAYRATNPAPEAAAPRAAAAAAPSRFQPKRHTRRPPRDDIYEYDTNDAEWIASSSERF